MLDSIMVETLVYILLNDGEHLKHVIGLLGKF